ncbi:late competence development ComFB family protein [Sporosarcina sp. GW1-11]|uniref:late competence development ComFB family protein n=1 Tax=Sporosarcina sp. GW1-11 TaxID=2899126 RepID=UPI00294FED53|nr:late competence development ComFB family protein [Sporosarcina sp. GW1-11]MDV6377004.1 late competence development ComFB family protein [Sporosarcina sp. GW1-11]
MKVHNMMEIVALDVLKKYKDQLRMPCTCEHCMNDVLAMTLNNLQPQYIVKESNSLSVRAVHEISPRIYCDSIKSCLGS